MRIQLMTAATMLCLLSAAHGQTPAGAPTAAARRAAPTTFVVTFRVKPGRNADFEKVMSTLQGKLARSEPGNIYYDLYLPAPDSQTYVLIEHYKDAAAVKAHGQDPDTQAMAAAVKDLLEGPPSAERLILVSSKPRRASAIPGRRMH